MKDIFSERVDVFRSGDGIHVECSTLAHYDEHLHVLCVDVCVNVTSWDSRPYPELPDEKRFLESIKTETAAIRRTIAIADEWRRLAEEYVAENKAYFVKAEPHKGFLNNLRNQISEERDAPALVVPASMG